jgi:hypothetical protein
MNVTDKRIAANRANAARSTGPKTAEGKARSSHNATKDGLHVSVVTLRNEDPEAFDAAVRTYAARMKPADDMELDMIIEMVAAIWRTRRSAAIETRMLNLEMENHTTGPSGIDRTTRAFDDLSTTPKLRLIRRYEQQFSTTHSRLLRDFKTLRAICPANPALAPTVNLEFQNEATKSNPINENPQKTNPSEPINEPTEPISDPDFPTCPAIDPELLK